MKSILRLFTGIVKLYLLGRRVPLFVLFLVTNRCDSLCKYCRIPLRQKDDEMPTERVLALIDELVASGTYRLGIFGGEPLVRNDIHQIVAHAKNKGLVVHLYTNGNQVKDKLDTIKLLDGLFISLDGPEEIHDQLRGKGNYRRVIEAIEAARRHVPVYLITVLSKQNRWYIEYVSQIAEKYGCLLNFQLVVEKPSFSPDVSEYKLSEEEERACILKIAELKKKNTRIALSNTNLRMMLKRRSLLPRVGYQGGIVKCWNGRAACSIDANGDVYSCFELIGREDVFNLKQHTFKEAFGHIKNCACKNCDVTCSAEYNYWLSFNPEAVFNLIGLLRLSLKKEACLK
jgi:MoaA/NifB/PqqE/SkfB family radical SAM enzyme